MDKNKLIIALLVIIIVLLVGMVLMPNFTKNDSSVEVTDNVTANENTNNPDTPDTITVELPEFDTKYTKTVGEYRVETENGKVDLLEVLVYGYIKMVNWYIKTLICLEHISIWMGNGNGVNGEMVKVRTTISIQ